MTDTDESSTDVEEIDDDTAALILQLQDVRAQIDLLTSTARDLTMAIEARVMKSAVINGVDGRPWRATVVRPDPRVKVNLDALRAWPEVYTQTVKEVADLDSFRRLAKAGIITREIVEAACTFTTITPSVRFMPLDSEEDTDE